MGREARCVASFAGASGEADVRLETDHVLVRGPFRLKLSLAELAGVDVEGDRLILGGPQGPLVLRLGVQASRWAEHIRNPKPRMAKLGIAAGAVVALHRIEDRDVHREVIAVGATICESPCTASLDVALIGADSGADLARLRPWVTCLADRGALWIVSRKGRAATLKDTQVMAACRGIGLVDTKVVAFSPTHTALRFVRPRKL